MKKSFWNSQCWSRYGLVVVKYEQIPHLVVHEMSILVSNWEKTYYVPKKFRILCRKRVSMLTGLKVSSLTCKSVFYRPEHNVSKN